MRKQKMHTVPHVWVGCEPPLHDGFPREMQTRNSSDLPESLLHGSPDAMHVVVVIQSLEKLAYLALLLFREGGEVFRQIA
jgi:hypothetical protein